ncbi:MAG: hypothetical protein RIC35_21680 [Marinoscillum sp.]
MHKQNRNLLFVFLGLALVNVLFLLVGDSFRGVSFDEDKFVVNDTTNIFSIQIGDNELKKLDGEWIVNDTYPVDQSLKRVLFLIMQRVQVKKPVDVELTNAIEVKIAGEDPLSFTVSGNPTKTKTYFSLEGKDEVYEVEIPGYKEYVGGIFELNADQWRDRLVMNESWRTIQVLTLDYMDPEIDDVKITFDKDFFLVEDISPIDSNLVVNYLNQFQYFQANEWVSKGRFPKYDSLSVKPPLATLTIESINDEVPYILEIFPKMPGERFFLVKLYDQSMLVIDDRRMVNILLRKNDFSNED